MLSEMKYWILAIIGGVRGLEFGGPLSFSIQF